MTNSPVTQTRYGICKMPMKKTSSDKNEEPKRPRKMPQTDKDEEVQMNDIDILDQ